MREELKDTEVTEVTGGTVVISAPMNIVGFNTLQMIFRIKGDIKEMRNRLLDLYDENADMSNEQFDILVRDDFKAKGWI